MLPYDQSCTFYYWQDENEDTLTLVSTSLCAVVLPFMPFWMSSLEMFPIELQSHNDMMMIMMITVILVP